MKIQELTDNKHRFETW